MARGLFSSTFSRDHFVFALGRRLDLELVYGFCIRLILAASGTPVQNVDQDAWARSSGYAKQDPARSIEALRINRVRLVRLLRTLPRESLELFGVHSERGKESVGRVVEMVAGHDINHLNQIKERLSRK